MVPRKPRLHVSGGLYHVILRGNGRLAIFFDAEDRGRWESQRIGSVPQLDPLACPISQ
jgi:hypothetical protein